MSEALLVNDVSEKKAPSWVDALMSAVYTFQRNAMHSGASLGKPQMTTGCKSHLLEVVRECLSPEERLILVLFYQEKLQFHEIGEILSISGTTAYQKYLNALFKVRATVRKRA